METVDSVVEKRLLKIISKFDTIITMGTRAAGFFRDKSIETDFHVVSGGIDPRRFYPAEEALTIDLVMTGRLVPIKRIDIFLQAVKQVVGKIPDVRAVIVGDGKLNDELQSLSMSLGVESNVSFVGHQDNIEDWLRNTSKKFLKQLKLCIYDELVRDFETNMLPADRHSYFFENSRNNVIPNECGESV